MGQLSTLTIVHMLVRACVLKHGYRPHWPPLTQKGDRRECLIFMFCHISLISHPSLSSSLLRRPFIEISDKCSICIIAVTLITTGKSFEEALSLHRDLNYVLDFVMELKEKESYKYSKNLVWYSKNLLWDPTKGGVRTVHSSKVGRAEGPHVSITWPGFSQPRDTALIFMTMKCAALPVSWQVPGLPGLQLPGLQADSTFLKYYHVTRRYRTKSRGSSLFGTSLI